MKFIVDINDEHQKVQIEGTIPDMCGCITKVIHAVREGMEEHGKELADEFLRTLTKGWYEGVVYGVDRKKVHKMIEEAKDLPDMETMRKIARLLDIFNDEDKEDADKDK